jgi:hypothetical protein
MKERSEETEKKGKPRSTGPSQLRVNRNGCATKGRRERSKK